MCHGDGCIFTRKVSDSVFFWERSKIEKNEEVKTSIILIKSSNKIFFEDKEVDYEFLKSKFENYNDESKIVLEVDKNLPVQNFTEILSIFKKNKFNKVFVRSVKVDDN